jgi:DNA-binding transcriptional LysR family regulator
MELRQLETFVAVADELHFGRAAERLHVAAPTLSELVRRLEREVGTPLFTRTTRRVALTPAGSELLVHAKVILDEVAAARAAVRRIAAGDAGAVRVGATPPAATVLAPHLVTLFADAAPQAEVELRRMWLPTLADALAAGEVDVAITCGTMPAHPGISSETFVAEELLVGLRDTHRFAAQQTVMLSQLCHDVLGVPPAALFPAWAFSVRNALDEAGVAPPDPGASGHRSRRRPLGRG